MSGGELILLVALIPTALLYWGTWFHAAFSTSQLVRPFPRQFTLAFCFTAALTIVAAVLRTGADPAVRGNIVYIVLFLLVSAVALGAMTAAGSLIGLSGLDDAIRRPNSAAAWAIAGVWIGTGLTTAGANIGRGDTIGTTNGPLVLGVATQIVLWAAWGSIIGMSSIAQDRDVHSGIRFAGLFVAWGLVLGRATAGDWESVTSTLQDFALQGSPVIALLVLAIAFEFQLRPSIRQRQHSAIAGLGPAAFYLAGATGWVAWWGRP